MLSRPLLTALLTLALAGSLPAIAQHHTTTPPKPNPHTKPTTPTPPAANRTNPLLPPQLELSSFFPDISLIQKLPAIAPQNFEPLYSAADWQTYRTHFGAEADSINRLKSSGVLEFANRLIAAAETPVVTAKIPNLNPKNPSFHPTTSDLHTAEPAPSTQHSPTTRPDQALTHASSPSDPTHTLSPGLRRLLLLRAAAIAYRNREGYPIANKAITAYQAQMDKQSTTQVAALWTLSNQISRMSVTPKPERIRYDAIAAKANMQLALLLLENDQVEPAQLLVKQLGYHEGWLKSDPATRTLIAQVRNRINATAKMMDYLATLYEPAVNNDPQALLTIYLYGRYIKKNPAIVADLPGRIPSSPLSQLAASIDAAQHDPTLAFGAAENLRVVAGNLPDGMLKQRTLYAALTNYRAFLNAPQTERDRIHRTLARISLEAVIADGAHAATPIDPFAPPPAPTVEPQTHPASEPATVGLASNPLSNNNLNI